ncbi:MAG: hypothetical protein M1829_002520 [Trizodia sp. TS-e1964]|nr:MAG: hypothetical protein M1829_002520 [Trizodia sp. TS-e1964]
MDPDYLEQELPAELVPAAARRFSAARLTKKLRRGSTMSTGSNNSHSEADISSRKNSIVSTEDAPSSTSRARPSSLVSSKLATGALRRFRLRSDAMVTKDGDCKAGGNGDNCENSKFAAFFLKLPTEIQTQILKHLPFTNLLSLRATSQTFLRVIRESEAPLARHHILYVIPPLYQQLYPPPPPSQIGLEYVSSLLYRQQVCTRLAGHISDHICREIFFYKSEAKRKKFAEQRQRMQKRMIPLIFTLFHFFENYRSACAKVALHRGEESDGDVCLLSGHQHTAIELQILGKYDPHHLLKVQSMYMLFLICFSQRLRPPSYMGRLERSLRGWSMSGPRDSTYVSILTIGGLIEVERLWSISVYSERRTAVDEWLLDMQTASQDHNLVNTEEGIPPGIRPSLPPEALKRMLKGDWPDLPSVWTTTAALILMQRGVLRDADSIIYPGTFINQLLAAEDEWGVGQQEAVTASAESDDDPDQPPAQAGASGGLELTGWDISQLPLSAASENT